jgi:hypothetical protein
MNNITRLDLAISIINTDPPPSLREHFAILSNARPGGPGGGAMSDEQRKAMFAKMRRGQGSGGSSYRVPSVKPRPTETPPMLPQQPIGAPSFIPPAASPRIVNYPAHLRTPPNSDTNSQAYKEWLAARKKFYFDALQRYRQTGNTLQPLPVNPVAPGTPDITLPVMPKPAEPPITLPVMPREDLPVSITPIAQPLTPPQPPASTYYAGDKYRMLADLNAGTPAGDYFAQLADLVSLSSGRSRSSSGRATGAMISRPRPTRPRPVQRQNTSRGGVNLNNFVKRYRKTTA